MSCTHVLCDLFEGLNWSSLWQVFIAVLPVWIFGAITGYLLPRPRLSSGNHGSFIGGFLNGSAIRKLTLAFHGAVIVREVWYHWTCPGTFRNFSKAVVQWVCGKGWHFDFPTATEAGAPTGCVGVGPQATDNWYVTEKDLAFFQYHGEGSGELAGAGKWEILMEKEIPNQIKYICWRRQLPNGKTEYKSSTISPDASAQEFSDMYFDDDNRPNWDTMIIEHEVVEHGDFAQRQQVVRWLRRFPFSFLSDREYVIARRSFKQDENYYGITKAVDLPDALRNPNVVKMDVFYSMWRSRAVSCPWGSGKPACETLLLHHEQFKIPENLARFAVKHGMWGFVRKLSEETPKFIALRRQRCGPFEADPQAYGYGMQASKPIRRTDTSKSALSTLSSLTTQSSADLGSDCGDTSSRQRGLPRSRSVKKLRSLMAFGIASGLALMMKKSSSSEKLNRMYTQQPDTLRGSKLRRHRYRYSEGGLAEVEGW